LHRPVDDSQAQRYGSPFATGMPPILSARRGAFGAATRVGVAIAGDGGCCLPSIAAICRAESAIADIPCVPASRLSSLAARSVARSALCSAVRSRRSDAALPRPMAAADPGVTSLGARAFRGRGGRAPVVPTAGGWSPGTYRIRIAAPHPSFPLQCVGPPSCCVVRRILPQRGHSARCDSRCASALSAGIPGPSHSGRAGTYRRALHFGQFVSLVRIVVKK